MAMKLKAGNTYNPDVSARYGVDMTQDEYYAVIDMINYDKKEQMCFFSVDIYGSQLSRSEFGQAVDRENFSYSSDKFCSKIGLNGISIPEAYRLASKDIRFACWESDE